MRLNTLINRVQRMRDEIDQTVKAACQMPSIQRWIVEANQAQLLAGKNADDELMNGGMYSRSHLRARIRRGLPVDHVYLSFTGNLQGSMQVVYTETGFSLVSSDWKQELVDVTMATGYWPSGPRYGKVFGLDWRHKSELSQKVASLVRTQVRNRLLRG